MDATFLGFDEDGEAISNSVEDAILVRDGKSLWYTAVTIQHRYLVSRKKSLVNSSQNVKSSTKWWKE